MKTSDPPGPVDLRAPSAVILDRIQGLAGGVCILDVDAARTCAEAARAVSAIAEIVEAWSRTPFGSSSTYYMDRIDRVLETLRG